MDQFYLTLAIFLLRVTMGLRMLFPAWKMIVEGPTKTKEYLRKVKGPFARFFHKIAGKKWITYLNAWLLLVSGFLLVFGIFVRPASAIGILLMFLYWLSKFPYREGIIDERLVYITVFLMLIMVNAGLWWGFDFLLLQIPVIAQFYQTHLWLQWLL